jgi:outer membrane protein assembly factor BamA
MRPLVRPLAVCAAILLAVAVAAAAPLRVLVEQAPPAAGEELRDLLEGSLRARWARAQDPLALERAAFEICADAGWPWSQCAFDSLGTALHVRPGPRASIGSLRSVGTDSVASQSFLRGSQLRSGQRWRSEHWRVALGRGLRQLGESGHPFAAASLQSARPDSVHGEGAVEVVVWVAPGPRMRFGQIHFVDGARSSVAGLRRLARLPSGELFSERALEDLNTRLMQREIVEDIEAVDVRQAVGLSDVVDIHMRLIQPERRGRFAAAVGVIEDRDRRQTRVSGSIDLELLDLFGSARQFGLAWLDDGRSRRRLDLRYLEPVAFSTPFDVALALGQRHEDDLYDSFLADASLRVPLQRAQLIDLGLGFDRTTFVSGSVDEARLRTRRRLLVALQLRRRRALLRSFFGELRSEIQAAWVRESGGGSLAAAPPSQSLLRLGLQGGWQFRPRLALLARSAWQSVESDERVLPLSEQLALGGATTLRGYAEDQFRGERLGFGGVEIELGEPRGGRAYVFGDLGWIQSRRELDGGIRTSEDWLSGFGLGLRSPLAFGAIDLSLAFAEEIRFETGKLHLKLIQEF